MGRAQRFPCGRVVAWLVGCLALGDGWMHGWMDGFSAVPAVPDSLYAVSGGFRRASNKKLLR